MPKYVIERELPGAGQMTAEQLREASKTSRDVAHELGPDIEWLQSYITDDKVYCVFVGSDEDVLVEHARCADIPADRISQVRTITDPSSAEGVASSS